MQLPVGDTRRARGSCSAPCKTAYKRPIAAAADRDCLRQRRADHRGAVGAPALAAARRVALERHAQRHAFVVLLNLLRVVTPSARQHNQRPVDFSVPCALLDSERQQQVCQGASRLGVGAVPAAAERADGRAVVAGGVRTLGDDGGWDPRFRVPTPTTNPYTEHRSTIIAMHLCLVEISI